MSFKSYKEVYAQIPEHFAAKYDDFDDPGIDGGLYEAASDYIYHLETKIRKIRKLMDHDGYILALGGDDEAVLHRQIMSILSIDDYNNDSEAVADGE